MGQTILGGKFEIEGTGTNEGAENRKAKCQYFKFLRSFFIIS